MIQIVQPQTAKDSEGFSTESHVVIASIRAYREGRHGNQKWANRAAFSEATDLFCFRCIPGMPITTAMTILNNGERFEITSVENVKGKGMYIEVLAKAVNNGVPDKQNCLLGRGGAPQ